jgi:ribosomal protein S18 acetylase RimI-like enzyme
MTTKQIPSLIPAWQIAVTFLGESIDVTADNATEVKLAIGRKAREQGTQDGWLAAAKACQVIVAMELEYALCETADKEDGQVVATNIRPMRWPQDEEAALWIEQSAFVNPIGSSGFLAMLRETNSLVLVAEAAKDVVAGYAHLTMHDCGWELKNIAVDGHFRRLGIGRSLVDYIKTNKLSRKRNNLFCSVREENLGAQLFCRANGLRCMTIVKNYYTDSASPAYFFRYVRYKFG